MKAMAKRSLGQQLDELVDAVLAQPEVAEPALPPAEARLTALARLATHLRGLPRQDFKARLKTDLERRATMATQPAMATKVRPIPEGFHTVTPYLCVKDAAGAIDFYKKAFGATEALRLPMPDGRIGHAEIRIGDSFVMLSDEFPEYGNRSPESIGGSPVIIHLYVADVDAVASQAVAAGAKALIPVQDWEHGDRSGRMADPFGHLWIVSTHKKGNYMPEGYHTATPYLIASDASGALEFYKHAFGARELMRMALPDGRIGHAEFQIGDSRIMLADEFPEYGNRSPRSFGGTPVTVSLFVEDVDALANQAVAAGAKVVRPVQDQFYGERSGRLEDPFGHIWIVSTHIEDVTPEEIRRRLDAFMNQPASEAAEKEVPAKPVKRIPEGFHTVTPYLTVQRAPELLDFLKGAFGAEELLRTTGSAGGMHAEMRIGDSRLMIGGGGAWRGTPMPTALHLYVTDTDAVYRHALNLGATSIHEPMDQDYGERSASVKDVAGNNWYIATKFGPTHIPEGLHSVNVYLHPRGADQVINFLKKAFAAKEVARYAGPDGTIHHAQVRIGDSVIEMGEAHGPYQPMPTMFYLYVEDADAWYKRALEAGATSISEPADQPYGDRNAGVKDPFDNVWYVATPIRNVPIS
jgi:PhnB protein